MKAFLMYRDRDFDPDQLLARRDRELRRSRGEDGKLDLRAVLPWNEEALRRDLGLDLLFTTMAGDDAFLFEVAQVAVLSSLTDNATIRYRQQILADTLQNRRIVRDIYRLTIEAVDGERQNYWGAFARYPAGTLHRAVDVLQVFVTVLKKLRGLADQHAERFDSEGFATLFSMLSKEMSDDYFAAIDAHLRRLKFRHGTLISARLGKGNEGRNYVLRKPKDDERSWLARLVAEKPQRYSYQLHPRDDAGARALSTLNDRGLNLVANALAQSTDHILSFFQMLRTELAFYIGCLNLHERLTKLSEPTCFPHPLAFGEQKLSFAGLYDPALALSMDGAVVGNDLDGSCSDIFIITGANSGGKSTFLRSVGLAQLMMQAGMFVAAEKYSAEICNGVITHYRREEDAGMESGKLDEELGRMSEIVDRLQPGSLVLFNESFASTNEREGSEIAGQIVEALLERRVKVFFVTHLYHFARSFFLRRRTVATFLRAERRTDAKRTFKLVEAEPMQTSYGEDIYRSVFSAEDGHPRRERKPGLQGR